MRFFDLDSPLMQVLNKVADLMWLNFLTLIFCIPVVTAGAALTAMHYMALKIVRNEECYITRGFFKSFKENFRQGTIIWLIFLAAALVLVGDFYIMRNAGVQFNKVIQVIIGAVFLLVLFTYMFVFPVLSKFENSVLRTIKNAFIMSILQFPKTVLMVLGSLLPLALLFFSMRMLPITFLFGLAGPAYLSALLYNKYFRKLEAQVEEAQGDREDAGEDDERIFKDELDQTLKDKEL